MADDLELEEVEALKAQQSNTTPVAAPEKATPSDSGKGKENGKGKGKGKGKDGEKEGAFAPKKGPQGSVSILELWQYSSHWQNFLVM